ncbi:MAG: plastocyanin/azurin family copper-binding protein [Haloarculaceae archaeon]
MDRRRFLRYAGIASTGLVAGCNAPSGGEGSQSSPGGSPAGGGGGAATQQASPSGGQGGQTQGGQTQATQAGNQTGQGASGGGGATNTIEMHTEGSNYYFDPIGLHVQPGETVTWKIASGSHSTTAYAESNPQASVRRIPQDAEAWDSGILTDPGATFEQKFTVEGTYDYYCIPHKTLGMVGRLVVGQPGGGVSGQPPDGNVPKPEKIVSAGAVGWSDFHSG